MTPLSQRDSKWANKLLGDSITSTIGNYGCLLTCIAMASGVNPDGLNDALKNVHGWQDDLLIWSKVKEAIPFDFKYPVAFDNDAVKQEIATNGFCVVWVDFDGKITSPNDNHYVLYIGNQQLIDPWTGTTKSTGWYPLVKGYSPCTKLTVPQPPVVIDKLDLGEPWGVMEKQAIVSTLNDMKRDLTNAQEKNKTLDGFISKWVAEWQLPTGSSLVDIEGEMAKLMALEDRLVQYRDAIEKVVGNLDTDSALLTALQAVKIDIKDKNDQITDLTNKLADCKQPNGYKFLKSWTIASLLFRLYKRG